LLEKRSTPVRRTRPVDLEEEAGREGRVHAGLRRVAVALPSAFISKIA
jgi:hypothetical protein